MLRITISPRQPGKPSQACNIVQKKLEKKFKDADIDPISRRLLMRTLAAGTGALAIGAGSYITAKSNSEESNLELEPERREKNQTRSEAISTKVKIGLGSVAGLGAYELISPYQKFMNRHESAMCLREEANFTLIDELEKLTINMPEESLKNILMPFINAKNIIARDNGYSTLKVKSAFQTLFKDSLANGSVKGRTAFLVKTIGKNNLAIFGIDKLFLKSLNKHESKLKAIGIDI